MKKGILLALLLGLLTVFTCTAAAAEGDFTIKDGVLTKYSGAGGAVVIPDGVTEIAREAFSDPDAAEPNRTITSVAIPAGVVKIGASAFSRCEALTSVSLPDGLQDIGSSAFSLTGLRSISIPGSVTRIGNGAFYNCASLSGVTLAEGLLHIDGWAFHGCPLQRVRLPDSTQYVGGHAFEGCTALTEVHIPETAWVDYDSFSGTPWAKTNAAVTEERMPTTGTGGVTAYTRAALTVPITRNGDFTLRGSVLTGYSGKGGAITLPEGITAIGKKAFYQNTAVTSVTVPLSLRAVGESAFEGCTALQSIQLPNDLHLIGQNAFLGCTAMEGFYMPHKAQVDRTAFLGTPYAATNGRHKTYGYDFQTHDVSLPADVTQKSWYAKYYTRVKGAELMPSDARFFDGRFHPDEPLYVGEAVKLAALIHQGFTHYLAGRDYAQWYQYYADYMEQETGLDTAALGDLNRPARRDEFAEILFAAFPLDADVCTVSVNKELPDISGDSSGQSATPYQYAIGKLYQAGIVVPYADGKFYPSKTITRAEAVVMAARAIDPTLRA